MISKITLKAFGELISDFAQFSAVLALVHDSVFVKLVRSMNRK